MSEQPRLENITCNTGRDNHLWIIKLYRHDNSNNCYKRNRLYEPGKLRLYHDLLIDNKGSLGCLGSVL